MRRIVAHTAVRRVETDLNDLHQGKKMKRLSYFMDFINIINQTSWVELTCLELFVKY
jgi:hypothetical protein